MLIKRNRSMDVKYSISKKGEKINDDGVIKDRC